MAATLPPRRRRIPAGPVRRTRERRARIAPDIALAGRASQPQLEDGVYQAVFRTRSGEGLAVTTLMDGRLLGRGPHLDVQGSLRQIREGFQAIVEVRTTHPQGLGGAAFGAAARVTAVLEGRWAPAAGAFVLDGALPGAPGERLTLELRAVRTARAPAPAGAAKALRPRAVTRRDAPERRPRPAPGPQ